MEILILITVFILGCCFGSFVNMWEYRLAVKYGLIKGDCKGRPYNENRSFCDSCGKQLNWFENIPIISWIIQKGKTRCCHKNLPISYPIVELVMGILFVGFVFLNAVLSAPGFFAVLRMTLGLVVIVFLVLSTVFDFKYMELPDFSTVVLVIGAILINYVDHNLGWNNLIAAIGASGFLMTLYLITKGKGMGMGDVKLAIFIGFLLGTEKTVLAFYLAFIIGAIVGIILMIQKKAQRNTAIPFGPYLILGTMMAWWWGDIVLNLIYRWF